MAKKSGARYIDKYIEEHYNNNQKIRVELNVFNESINKEINHLLLASQFTIFNLDTWTLSADNLENAVESVEQFIAEQLIPQAIKELRKTLKEKIRTYLQAVLRKKDKELVFEIRR